MDEAMREQALNLIMGLLLIVMLALGLLSMLIGKLVSWWDAFLAWRRGGGVKTYDDAAPVVMSRSEPLVSPSVPSSLETDGRTAETTAPGPKFTEDQLLTLYALMRVHGVARDKASQALKAAGIPMNNNLWAKAAPPLMGVPIEDDDTTLTPIAGRRTKASFYPGEPDLEFQPPPR